MLRLAHHRHTGRRLPHHHTSYHAILVILAVFGLCLISIRHAAAGNYVVTAKVSAPLPGVPSVITDPASGLVTTDPNITISGSCPVITPAIIVLLYRNGVLVGSMVCPPSGQFSFQTTLLYGNNVFVPKIINITDDYGQDGQPITIVYRFTESKPPTNKLPNIPLKADHQMYLNSADQIVFFKPGEGVTLALGYGGGIEPYTLIINWGDGTEQSFPIDKAGHREVSHTFGSQKSFEINMRLTDAQQHLARLSLAAVSLVANQDIVTASPRQPSVTYRFEQYFSDGRVYATLLTIAFSLLAVDVWLYRHWGKYAKVRPGAAPFASGKKNKKISKSKGKR